MATKPPARHAILEETARELRDVLGKDQAVLQADPEPERKPRDQPLAIVDPILNDDPHADHEQHPQQHRYVGRRHRARYRQDHGERLGNERQNDKHRPQRNADAARRPR